jgi:CRP/FNR family transcriptional regulator, cyclic AMP receptor protein
VILPGRRHARTGFCRGLPLPLVEVSITLTNMNSPRYEDGQPLVTEAEMATLERIGHTLQRSAGDPFFLEGEPGDSGLLIKKGHVKILKGQPPRIVAIRGPGEIVGEMGVSRGKTRSASVVAFDAVEAFYLPAAKWLDFLYANPRAFHALAATLAERADQATGKFVESELAVAQQLAKSVVRLTDSGLGDRIDEGQIVLRLSQQDLASLIGAKKLDSVKKVIRQLKASGTIATGRQQITLLDLPGLREIANGDRTVSS